jgi:hypothetical protein
LRRLNAQPVRRDDHNDYLCICRQLGDIRRGNKWGSLQAGARSFHAALYFAPQGVYAVLQILR